MACIARRLFFALSFATAAMALTQAVAHASMDYPGLIQSQLALSCSQLPACTICHDTAVGGLMTVHTKFGSALMGQYGLVAKNPGALKAVIAQAQADGLDANGDTIPDIQAIIECRDPNVAPAMTGEAGAPVVPVGPASSTDPTLEHGCAMSTARPGLEGAAGGFFFVGGTILVWCRRRGRRGNARRRTRPVTNTSHGGA